MFYTNNIIEMLNRYYAFYSCRNICYAHLKCALKQGTVNIKNWSGKEGQQQIK